MLQLRPNYGKASNNLGVVLFRMGLTEEAISAYTQALSSNPRFVEAKNNLGVALIAKGEVDAAIAQFRGVLQISPDNEQALDYLKSLKGRPD